MKHWANLFGKALRMNTTLLTSSRTENRPSVTEVFQNRAVGLIMTGMG